MPLFTKNEFTSLAERKAAVRGQSVYTILNEARLEFKTSSKIGIFLSHSHQDKTLIKDAITFFKTINVTVYVDWLDQGMPVKTNGETAQKIKSKIKSLEKFILLATNSAVNSKWCNWELGIGDIYKFTTDNLAILPLADNSGTWDGNEYLQIYPRIESILNRNFEIYDSIFKIHYPDGKTKYLSDWLKQ